MSECKHDYKFNSVTLYTCECGSKLTGYALAKYLQSRIASLQERDERLIEHLKNKTFGGTFKGLSQEQVFREGIRQVINATENYLDKVKA